MKLAQLKAYKVSEIVFNNNIQGTVQLKLSNKVTYNVKYNSGHFCEGSMCVEVFDKNNFDALNVKVTVSGMFEIEDGAEKELIHVETFKELFPFAKMLITTISANAGIKPIMVQNVDIDNQEIYRLDMNAAKEES